MNKTTDRIRRYWCHAIAALVSLCIVVPISYMAMDRDPPFVPETGFMTPVDTHPNDNVEANWIGVKTKVCPGLVYRTVIDSAKVIHAYAPVQAAYFDAEGQVFSRSFQLPANIALGPATYQAKVQFYCNPIHYLWPVENKTPLIKFNITAKPPIAKAHPRTK